ncbi:hypothetical protein SLEP1_g34075 [Rubroshorea leprosula]|uniref:Uncharacterized protein n=1 Tax=Rubroshorea leprosula TaxID=152421 RepID=A0AAV5KIM5_9ROSI|nr:hypothetical protein SLEP1_g34075 [Rubroshorea leprosula]
MAGTRETGNGRLRRMFRTLKRMKAKAATKRAEMCRLREETAQIVSTMEQTKFERNLLKMSLDQHSDDLVFISEAVDDFTQIILQL